MIPRFTPIIAACVRSWAPSFDRMLFARGGAGDGRRIAECHAAVEEDAKEGEEMGSVAGEARRPCLRLVAASIELRKKG